MPTLSISCLKRLDQSLEIVLDDPSNQVAASRLFVAVAPLPGPFGSAILPAGENAEGSTLFLPFQAQRLFIFEENGVLVRDWQDWQWQEAAPSIAATFETQASLVKLMIPLPETNLASAYALSIYRKSFAKSPWGELIAANEPGFEPGFGDRTFSTYDEWLGDSAEIFHRNRLQRTVRPVIYQLFVRHFSNLNENRKIHGTLAENGVGKFSGITPEVLVSLKNLGITHLWLTGVLQQATGTDYSAIGAPADDPDILKGLAGSPYAIKDYFDVCPDYADEPANRLAEFRDLLGRIHAHGLRAMIDFIPNHVARSYASDIFPELEFGKNDDRRQFFSPTNNFFYLQTGEPPLRLPRPLGEGRDGLFAGELDHGKVTGNDAATWTPTTNDWYETIKLNYGYDFTTGARVFPSILQPVAPVPDTWFKMDAILAYWQAMGVDGFRCDMAHMIPPEFWKWALHRARNRQPGVYFMAEAYNDDPAKVASADSRIAAFGNVMIDLLDAGFDAVYDDPSYKILKNIYDGGKWANDLRFPHSYVFQNGLRYAENHDEVRLTAAGQWNDVGLEIGPAVTALLAGVGSGPILIYQGQEFGAKPVGSAGFAGDNGRTTIFDYWSLPSLVDWHLGRLSPAQVDLRERYRRLLREVVEPPFADGRFVALNPLNLDNPDFGRLPGETASGHWLYGFLRVGKIVSMMLVNLHPKETLHAVKVRTPFSETPVLVGDIFPASWIIRIL